MKTMTPTTHFQTHVKENFLLETLLLVFFVDFQGTLHRRTRVVLFEKYSVVLLLRLLFNFKFNQTRTFQPSRTKI